MTGKWAKNRQRNFAGAIDVEVTTGSLLWDFGKVGRRRMVEAPLGLTNKGGRTVRVTRVQRSCGGCAPLTLDRDRMAPGESIAVIQRYRTGNRVGPETRAYHLLLEDGRTSRTLAIRARWSVEAFVEWRPEVLDFGRIPVGAPLDTKITLRSRGTTEPLVLLSARSSSRRLRLGEVFPDRTGTRLTLPVRIGAEAPIGAFSSTITLRTNCANEPVLHVPVRGVVEGPFSCSSRYLNFGLVARGDSPLRQAAISVSPRGRWSVREIEYDRRLLDCRISLDPYGRYLLSAQLAGAIDSGTCKTTVTLKTDCPAQPAVLIPVLAIVK